MKKKLPNLVPIQKSGIIKIVRTMKLALIIVFLSVLQVSANVYSQVTVNLDVQGKPIREVLKTIEQQSQVRFFYSDDLLVMSELIDVKADNKNIIGVLDDIFSKSPLTYKAYDNNLIVIAPRDLLQQQKVTGTVIDKDGKPLPGVNVVVTGTTMGTLTDAAGKYSIEVPQGSKSLTFSFIGMVAQEITIGTLTQINVTMAESAIGLDEVVVVGYGTQKKVNLTGSVSSVKIEELEKKTVSQASQLLAGEISGVTVSQANGNPGSDGSTIRIRGLGTFSNAGNNPLVIIDGFPGSIDAVDPNNIVSVSVLKDAASASIYGSRAANGVILITTKEGKEGELNISYNGYVAQQSIVKMPQFVDSWTYAEAYNEVQTNMGAGAGYTQAEIDLFKAGTDLDNYPNKSHYKDILSSGNGMQTRHNLTFSGGSSKSKFLLSTGYLKQNGLVDRNYSDRYDMQLNVSQQMRKNVLMEVRLSGFNSVAEEPVDKNQAGVESVINGAMRLNNTIPGKKSDGTYGYLSDFAPEAFMDSKNFQKSNAQRFAGNLSLNWEIIDGLSLTARGNYNVNGTQLKQYSPVIEINPSVIYSPSQINVQWANSTDLTLELLARYNKRIGDHNFGVLAGASRETYNRNFLNASRDNVPGDVLYELDAASAANMQNAGGGVTWKLESYFGRLNYSYKDKYLFETNVRYDGSSRFSKANRFGFFPSVSAGWRISGEDFFKNGLPWVDDLKLRGSIGTLGNQQIGNYPYQKTLDLGHNYPIGGILQPGAALTTLPFEGISWETTTVTDVGIDLTVLKNKLSITADYFYRKTDDILYTISVSSLLGLASSEQNAGSVENKGWDFELNYNESIGDFSFSIRPNFSVVSNKVLSLANVDEDINNGLFVGESLSAIYGYETDGLFVDADDIATYAHQPYTAKPGFMRYKDISGPDGVRDSTVNAYDRKVIGSGMPKFTFGAGISARYKGFDLYVQLQGLAGYSKLPSRWMFAFYNGGNIQQWQWDERWTEENPDRNAKYPRLQEESSGSYTTDQACSYWLMDASFLRLKNVQIGYTIPKGVIPNVKDFRIYVSATNLLTFDNYWEGWDPEMNSTGSGHYPLSKMITCGVNINF